MIFSFLTLFPRLIEGYFQDSILKNAKDRRLITIQTINIRDFATDSHKSADFAQIGGGAGQVLCPQVIDSALSSLTNQNAPRTKNSDIQNLESNSDSSSKDSIHTKPHIIFLTPNGKPFHQNDALRLAKKSHIAFVCGRYEGIDERAIEVWADEVFCIGDFILTGGELGALCICDSIARQIPGVLGNNESLLGESFEEDLLEAPVFARSLHIDEKFQNFMPPSEYSKGNHSKIADLKNKLAMCKTRYFRPDLFQKYKTTKRLNNEK